MIIVNLKGGLGNQMFQYALGRALALKNQDELKLDLSTLRQAETIGNIPRPYELEHFSIVAGIATEADIAQVRPTPSPLATLGSKIRNRLRGDPTVCFNAPVLSQTGNIYLDGFWQSPRYFNDIKATLLRDFTLKETTTDLAAQFASQIKDRTAVSLHVRRGDYAQKPRVTKEFGICSLRYYTDAVAHLQAEIHNPTFFIFSDDIPWAKEHLPLGEDTVHVTGEGLNTATELILMSQCQHNIIANSSFSWWGAWLNQNPEKIVVAPTPWFDTARYDRDLLPPSWLQLPK